MTRLNLALSEDVRDRLEAIKDETHAESVTEVIRRALAVYDLLVCRQKAGAKLLIRENSVDQEVLLIP